MKILSLAFLFALITPAQAATVKLTGQQALELVDSLLLSGAKANTTKPLYKIEITDLSCRTRYVSHAGSPEDLLWGMSEYECTNPVAEGAKAKALVIVLGMIEEALEGKLMIKDCAMGRCYDTLRKVSCTIDSNEAETEKRFFCELTDTQE